MENEDYYNAILKRSGLKPEEYYTEEHDYLTLYHAKTGPQKMRVIKFRPENLSKGVKNRIVKAGMLAFGPDMTEEEIMEHIMPTDNVYVGFRDSDVMGFATANIEEDAIDFVGSAVHPDYLRKGLYSEFVMQRVTLAFENNKSIIKLRTQNPIIYLGVTGSLDHLVDIDAIEGYDVEKEHVKRLYGRMLTSIRPYSGIKKIDSMFDVLDYKAGDAFSLEFRMKREK